MTIRIHRGAAALVALAAALSGTGSGTLTAAPQGSHAGGDTAAFAQAAATGADLSLKLEQERRVVYRLVIESRLSIEVFGQKQEQDALFDADVELFGASAREDGTRTITARFNRLLIRIDGGLNPGAFDSADPNPADSVYTRACSRIVGRPLELVLDRAGRLERVDGLDTLAPDAQAESALFSMLFDQQAARRFFEPLVLIKPAPATEVDIGQSWEIRQGAAGGIGLRAATPEFTLSAVDGTVARITVAGAPDTTPPDDLRQLPGVAVDASSLTGEVRWDLQRGELQKLETESRVSFLTRARGPSISAEISSKTAVRQLP